MVKAIGPTVPRWRLGELLAQARDAAGVSYSEAAGELDCSDAKIRRIEAGEVGVTRPELRTLLDLYRVKEREQLEELQQMGKQRGWWAPYGRYLTTGFTTLLGVESAATAIRSWEPVVVPGLLQTEAYARALARAFLMPADEIERMINIRLTRQARIWGEDPPTGWYVIDESVLLRRIGGDQIMREQLERLLDPPTSCTVQVIPLRTGDHPGLSGGLTIFEFEPDMHSPIAHVESHAGAHYLEEAELDRCRVIMDHMMAVALPPTESKLLIRDILARNSPESQEEGQS